MSFPDLLKGLQKGISFIWHGVNDQKNLEFFLKSNIYWPEGDLRASPEGVLVLRHDPFESHPLRADESLLVFRDWLEPILAVDRGIQIDLKEGGRTMDEMIEVFQKARIPESRLWFTTNLKDVPMEDYARLGRTFPGAILQSTIPLRFMFHDMGLEERRDWLELNRGLGARSLSISWYEEPTAEELDELRRAGFGVNLFYVNTIEDIRRAVALKPDSITSDFHIPEWGLYGRGSGENGYYLEKA
jgi:glycerophosphoryl diester phosphodiesterase